jgi:hypothetical protein
MTASASIGVLSVRHVSRSSQSKNAIAISKNATEFLIRIVVLADF